MKKISCASKLSAATKLAVTALVTLSVFPACAPKRPAPPPPPQYYTHTINFQGETLAQIAKWYTGSANNWREIAANNPDLNVKKMRIGTAVLIPESMMIRREDMPRSVMKSKPKEVVVAEAATDAAVNADGTMPQPAVDNSAVAPPDSNLAAVGSDTAPSDVQKDTEQPPTPALEASSDPEVDNPPPSDDQPKTSKVGTLLKILNGPKYPKNDAAANAPAGSGSAAPEAKTEPVKKAPAAEEDY